MRILIIEDEKPALNRIQKMLQQIDETIDVVATCDSIASSVDFFSTQPKIELALMDIELADGQSFEIFNRTQVNCPVIFTTAYDDFALKAFKLNSIDYLLKPIDPKELAFAIQKYKQWQKPPLDYPSQFLSLIEKLNPQPASYKNRFLVKTGTKMVSIPVSDIAYFHAFEKVVYLHSSQQKWVVDFTLEKLIETVDPSLFFLLNRQYLVHIQSIKQIHTYFNGKLKVDLQPMPNEEVIVSKEKAATLKDWLNR